MEFNMPNYRASYKWETLINNLKPHFQKNKDWNSFLNPSAPIRIPLKTPLPEKQGLKLIFLQCFQVGNKLKTPLPEKQGLKLINNIFSAWFQFT